MEKPKKPSRSSSKDKKKEKDEKVKKSPVKKLDSKTKELEKNKERSTSKSRTTEEKKTRSKSRDVEASKSRITEKITANGVEKKGRSSSKDKTTKDKDKKIKSHEKSKKYDENKQRTEDKPKKKTISKSKEKETPKNGIKFTPNTKEESDLQTGFTREKTTLSLSREKTSVDMKQREEGNDYNYDDEEFDSYDDDFEEDEEDVDVDVDVNSKKPDSDVQNETEDETDLNTESTQLHTPKKKKPGISEDSDSIRPQQGTDSEDKSDSLKGKFKKKGEADQRRKSMQSRIDFSNASAGTAQPWSEGSQKRGKVLLNLITMDSVDYNVFELAAVKDYEIYMQNFGNSNRIQAHTQTNEDSVERDVQTSELDCESKWTQMPPTDSKGVGGEKLGEKEDDGSTKALLKLTEYYTSLKFKRFINKAGQLFLDLVNEASDSVFQCENTSQSKMTTGYTEFTLGPLAKKSPCCGICFHDPTNTLAVIFNIIESPVAELVDRTIICVYNINNLKIPKRVLLTSGVGLCITFSPSGGAIVAGMDEGSLVGWNLGDFIAAEEELPWGDNDDDVNIQYPSYCTATGTEVDADADAVIDIVTLAANSSTETTSYQLASLQSNGTIQIWTALKTNQNEVDVDDLGIAPGSSLRLVKSSMISNISPFFSRTSRAFCLCTGMSSGTSGHLLVGTDSGYISHCVRHSNNAIEGMGRELEAPADVLCLDASSFDPSVILAGSSDGSIRLYHMPNSIAVAEFRLESPDGHHPINYVRWSRQSPYIFYSINGESLLIGWDMKKNGRTAAHTEKLGTSKITGLQIAENDNDHNSYMGLTTETGETRVYLLPKPSGQYSLSEDGHKLIKMIERI